MTKLYVALIALILLGQGLAAEPCLDRSRTMRLNEEFDFRTNDKAVVDNLCDTKNPLYSMLKVLMALEDLPPLIERRDATDQGIIRGSPFEFLRARVRRIIFEPTSRSYCRVAGDTHVSAYAGLIGSGEIHVCRAFLEDPFIDQMDNLLHEARHLDSGVSSHVQCNHGSFLGLRACDPKYESRGAYAVGLEFFVKLSRTEAVPETIRAEAREKAISDFINRFNRLPLDILPGALLLGENGEIQFYSAGTVVMWNGPVVSALAMRDDFPVALRATVGSLQVTVDGAHWSNATGNLAEKYSGLAPGERSSVADIFYAQPWAGYSCILLESSMRCWSKDFDQYSVTNWQFRARRFIYGSDTAPSRSKTLYILADNGGLYKLPEKFNELRQMTAAKYTQIQNVDSIVEAAAIGNQKELILKTDGQVIVHSRDEHNSNPVLELIGSRFKKIIYPYYWSQTLQNL